MGSEFLDKEFRELLLVGDTPEELVKQIWSAINAIPMQADCERESDTRNIYRLDGFPELGGRGDVRALSQEVRASVLVHVQHGERRPQTRPLRPSGRDQSRSPISDVSRRTSQWTSLANARYMGAQPNGQLGRRRSRDARRRDPYQPRVF